MKINSANASIRNAVVLAALVACSGSSDSTGPSAPAIPDGFARFVGTIIDDRSQPVSGANVLVPFGNNLAWSQQTGADGKYDFFAKASDYAGVSPVAMIVYKDRYLPRTFFYTSIAAGSTLNLPVDPANATRQLAANELVPGQAYRLVHLGDNNFSGDINSQLQTTSLGQSMGFPVIPWSSLLAQQYQHATIQFIARGIQSNLCPGDRAGIYAEGGALTIYGTPSDSDPNGNFTRYQFSTSIPTISAGTRLMFGFVSGSCSAGDLDDFEFAEVLVTLQP